MRIAVLSGKGGTGKTFVSTNLAATIKQSTYIDCDIEEPNGYLFLKPKMVEEVVVSKFIPRFDETKCVGCRDCVDFCKFNALIYLRKKPKIFSDVCHSCGGCMIVCKNNAITEDKHEIGKIQIAKSKEVNTVTGVLNISEATGVPIIKECLEIGFKNNQTTVIDCPPGSACTVMESISQSDYCIIVVEPTAFGFHNFKMVYELVKLVNKPCGVVINKNNKDYEPLQKFLKENNIKKLLTIPFSKEVAEITSNGMLAIEESQEIKNSFENLLKEIKQEV